jgi:vacuolar protein sorting-associated protein 41
VLPLGGITPAEVTKLLEAERNKDNNSSTFALELAFVKEQFGEDTEAEAREILELYLKGTKCLMLAVSYTQRAIDYTPILWQMLIENCLSNSTAAEISASADGSLFGSLLEAAALSGADLAKLVNQIPPGMAIEGLRPKLVAAVADYRLKLQMHQSSSSIAHDEKIDLLRELAHRSRRGVRSNWNMDPVLQKSMEGAEKPKGNDGNDVKILAKTLLSVERRDCYRLSFLLPMR